MAQELLGEEHGAAWDMMDWANAVLGKKIDGLGGSSSPSLVASPTYSSSRKFCR